MSEKLITAPQIAKVSFTGSTPVGKQLMALAARGVKRTTMELGGNAPVIVFEDADYDKTIAALKVAKFRNAGQVCVSPARFFVHESLADRFARDMADHAAGLTLGSGLEASTAMGPLANIRRVEAMQQFVADAETLGGAVLAGGKRLGNAGHFFEPTVITGLTSVAKLFSEECFGPILPVMPFATLDEAIALANGVEAGLSGYAFTRDLETARQVMHRVRTGMVGINTLAISTPEAPFGGVGESGHGSEGGAEGLEAYLDTKLVSMGCPGSPDWATWPPLGASAAVHQGSRGGPCLQVGTKPRLRTSGRSHEMSFLSRVLGPVARCIAIYSSGISTGSKLPEYWLTHTRCAIAHLPSRFSYRSMYRPKARDGGPSLFSPQKI